MFPDTVSNILRWMTLQKQLFFWKRGHKSRQETHEFGMSFQVCDCFLSLGWFNSSVFVTLHQISLMLNISDTLCSHRLNLAPSKAVTSSVVAVNLTLWLNTEQEECPADVSAILLCHEHTQETAHMQSYHVLHV